MLQVNLYYNSLFYILLGLITSALSQGGTVGECPTDITPLAPHEFFSTDNGLTFCSPASNVQDAVICFPQAQGDLQATYSITDRMGVLPMETCILAPDQNPCDSGYDGIFVQLSLTNQQGQIELTSSAADLRSCIVTYNRIWNELDMLQIASQTFMIPGTLTIENMLFGRPPAQFTVCELLENGTVVSIPVSVRVDVNMDCTQARSGNQIDLSTARLVTLRAEAAFTQDRTASLFLTTSSSCSPDVPRVTNNFDVTFVNSTSVTTQPTDPSSSTPTPDTVTIVVAVTVPLAVIVIVALCIAVTCLFRRRRRPVVDQPVVTELVDSGGSITSLHANGNGHVPAPLTTQGTDDNDSGVGSPGPTTPLKNNCVMIVCQNQELPWYKRLFQHLGVEFHCQLTMLSLPEDPDKLEHFKRDVYHYLQDDHVHHLLLFLKHGDSESPYSIALNKVIKELESRAAEFLRKVWVVYLCAPKAKQVHTAIHRLFLTQTDTPDNGLSDQCAIIIQKAIANSELPGGSEESLQKTTSLVPGKFPVQQRDHLKPELTSSWPMERKLNDKLDKLLAVAQEIKTTGEETAEEVHRTAEEAHRTAEEAHRTAEEAHRTAEEAHRTAEEVHRTSETIERTATAVESLEVSGDKAAEDLQHIRGKVDQTAESVQKTEAEMPKLSAIQSTTHNTATIVEELAKRQDKNEIEDERKQNEDPSET